MKLTNNMGALLDALGQGEEAKQLHSRALEMATEVRRWGSRPLGQLGQKQRLEVPAALMTTRPPPPPPIPPPAEVWQGAHLCHGGALQPG